MIALKLIPMLLMACLCMPVMAQQNQFPASTELDGKRLVLNGAGTRYRTIIKVYDLALYTPKKATTPESILAQKGPYRVRLVALRNIDTNDIGRAMVVGMQDNLPPEQAYKLSRYTNLFSELFATHPQILKGQVFGADLIPGKGAFFYLDGQQLASLNDPAFFEPFLNIWLGHSPADNLLKDQLLGVPRELRPQITN